MMNLTEIPMNFDEAYKQFLLMLSIDCIDDFPASFPVKEMGKERHRKHFHASMEEGRYHNGSRSHDFEKCYNLFCKAEQRREDKVAFKKAIPSLIEEAEEEFADKAEAEWDEEYYSNLEKYYANIFSDYERGFEHGKEYALKILRKMGLLKGNDNKFTVKGLGEVSFEDLERYSTQM